MDARGSTVLGQAECGIWQATASIPKLGKSDVLVWKFNPAELRSYADFFETLLSREEKTRLDRFFDQESRFNFVQCRGVLHYLIARLNKCEMGRVKITQGKTGKPELVEGRDGRHLFFNISHTRDLCLLAFSYSFEVGIDVEKIHPIKEIASLAHSYLSPDELKDWEEKEGTDQQGAFFDYWCAKEAILKGLGCGLSIHPGQINVKDALAGKPICGMDDNGRFFEIREYTLLKLPLGAEYRGWLAVLGTAGNVGLLEFTGQLLLPFDGSAGKNVEK